MLGFLPYDMYLVDRRAFFLFAQGGVNAYESPYRIYSVVVMGRGTYLDIWTC